MYDKTSDERNTPSLAQKAFDAIQKALAAETVADGSLSAGCPVCNYNKGSLLVQAVGPDTLFMTCAVCHQTPAIRAHLQGLGISFAGVTITETNPNRLRNQLRAIADFERGLPDHPYLWTYQEGRGITASVAKATRLLLNQRNWKTGTSHPCMISAVRDVTGQHVAGHYTFLGPQGAGQIAEHSKLMLGPVKASAVHLGSLAEVELVGRVAVTEGIETGLSVQVRRPFWPVWAALSTSGLRSLELPPAARIVSIWEDHDPPGILAAYAAEARWKREGRHVERHRPDRRGDDWNDQLRREAAEQEKA